MNDKIISEWSSEYKKTKSNISTIDGIGKAALILVKLGSIIKDGFSAMKLTGRELEKANAALAKSAIKMGYEPIGEVVLEVSGILDVKPTDGLGLAFGKNTLHFFLLDMTTPSFWASKLSGADIEQINKKVTSEIEAQKDSTLKNLDQQISKAEMNLVKLKVNQNCNVPNLY